ncbi:hypothetical protein ABPG75_002024 [Micractinium tetrahymenae]
MDLRKALGLDQAHIGQEENICSYEIYPPAPADQSDGSAAADLEALRTQLLDHLLPFLRDYIWQRDRFVLQLSAHRPAPWQAARRHGRQRGGSSAAGPATAAAEPPLHLWGCVNFGDNVEDEWFVVWLLLELTRAFPGVTARVWDNDGEFLLIEAAYALPRWLKPETAQNRVWLHGGALHLVPLPRFKGDPLLGATPSLAQALAAVRGNEIDMAAPQRIRAALLPRISGYPAKAAEQAHIAHALVPARVAHLLREEPQLLAAAVEAFHYRDPDDVKAAARMAAFPPRDMLLVAARFSRCLYAQLALQEFAPPRCYPMPMPSDPQYKAAEVGLKLTAGFEMMYGNRARFGRADSDEEEGQQRQRQQQPAEAAAGEPAAAAAQQSTGPQAAAAAATAASSAAGLDGDAAWAAFRSRLESSGYFRGAIPGSAQHSALLQAAGDSYRQTAAYRASTAALAAPARHVDAFLAQPIGPSSFPPPEQLPPEGSEAWLQAGAQAQLEAELAQRQAEQEAEAARKAARRQGAAAQGQRGGSTAQPDDSGAGGQGQGQGDEFDPGELAGRLRTFVDMIAGLEGAELPGDAAAGGSGSSGGGGGGGGVSLDEAKFAAELQRVLGLGKDMLRGLEQRAGSGEEDGWDESSEEGSSFFSDEEEEGSEEEEEEQQQQEQHQQAAQPAASAAARAGPAAAKTAAAATAEEGEDEEERRRQEGWEADTATDSDDDAQFMAAYGRAMDAQLAGTRMVESFERAPTDVGSRPAQQAQAEERRGSSGAAAGTAAAEGAEAAEAAAEAAALRPVDIDLNLVNSLLASYGEQQGLPGPAGSLAGLLGLKLPDKPSS